MTWKTPNAQTTYRYYFSYKWPIRAVYGEGSSISSNLNRYSELFSSFHPNGGAQRIMCYGKMPSGTFSQVDNLTVTYSGNRISTVLDAAQTVTTTGSMDFHGGSSPKTFAYNNFGAIVKDQSRGISNISYDNIGNPVKITYADGMSTTNVYSATGEKLKTVHITAVSAQADAMSMMETAMDMYSDFDMSSDEDSESTDTAESESETATAEATDAAGESTIEYRGPVIYKDGIVDMVLFPGGYATVSGGVTFHYYTQDYLGNNRAVINGTTGAIEQTISYYPYGGIIPELSTNSNTQPFKFGGKELITANGLNEYDFGARQYYQAVPHFTRIDPLCEDTPNMSPYLYCGNNPVNAFDLNGMHWVATRDETGHITWSWNEDIQSLEQALENGYVDYRQPGSIIDNARIGDGERGSVYLGDSASDAYYVESNSTVTPWKVGTEWLTGKGPRERFFGNGDSFAEMLRKHSHYQEAVKKAMKSIRKGEMEGDYNYTLGGIGGVSKYLKDYSTLLSFGITGNLAVTYLGSYNLSWTGEIIGGDTILHFTITNHSTIQSATRPPVLGYTQLWKNTVGNYINSKFEKGPGSQTTQTFNLTDTIR